jgi:benzoate 4-monooxygenase
VVAGGWDEKQKLEEKFLAFSKGPRGCTGQEIVMLMLERSVVGVLEKWDPAAKGSLSGSSFLEMQYTGCGMAFLGHRNN